MTPAYCLSTLTVSAQSLSDIQPNGLPAVFGVIQFCHDHSASRLAITGSIAGENFLAIAIISSGFWRP